VLFLVLSKFFRTSVFYICQPCLFHSDYVSCNRWPLPTLRSVTVAIPHFLGTIQIDIFVANYVCACLINSSPIF